MQVDRRLARRGLDQLPIVLVNADVCRPMALISSMADMAPLLLRP